MTIYTLVSCFKPFVRCWVAICLTAFVVGCANTMPLEETISVATIQVTRKPSTAIVPHTTITSTITPIPVNIITTIPTETPILPTITSLPLSTLTPVPTLTFGEREALIQGLMITNGECQLPCWWGIESGDRLGSIGQMFTDFGIPGWNTRTSNLGSSGLMGSIVVGYYDSSNSIFYVDISLNFYTVDKMVQYIRVSSSRPHSDQGQQEFVRDWQQYFLSSILQNYGKPSQVYLRLRSIADPTPTPIYSLSLLYPEKGISITYNLEGIWLGDNQLHAELCLVMANTNPLELSLFNPQYFEEWGDYFPPYNDELYIQSTWEARTGMDLDTFYQTYQDPNNLECVQINN